MIFKRITITNLILIFGLTFSTASLAASTAAPAKITVYAAASLTNALNDIALQYQKENNITIVSSYASTATLAKQIENGAPADIFIAADIKWMHYLQEKNRIQPNTKHHLLGNHLVLIAPKGQAFAVNFQDKQFDLAKAFNGRLCTGDVDTVPVGIYAKQSLKALHWWDSLQARIVGAQDVRAALAFVERGECTAGIVYATDAKVSTQIETLATLPDDTHQPIVYPAALVAGASPQSSDFLNYLNSPQAHAIFVRYGFSVLTQ